MACEIEAAYPSQYKTDVPQIAELDLNPVKVMPQGEGYRVVDAKIAVK
jgi:hypothetical protein